MQRTQILNVPKVGTSNGLMQKSSAYFWSVAIADLPTPAWAPSFALRFSISVNFCKKIKKQKHYRVAEFGAEVSFLVQLEPFEMIADRSDTFLPEESPLKFETYDNP